MVHPGPSGPRSNLSLHRMLALLLLPAVFFLAGATGARAATVTCDRAGCGTIRDSSNNVVCFTPAMPAPSTLWDQLQPADTGRLPLERDTTNFNELKESYGNRNWFYGIDIQNGWIIIGLSHGIGIWDARTDPAAPAFIIAQRYPSSLPGQFPFIPYGEQAKIVFSSISAPDDTMAAQSGYSGSGILIYDLTDKTRPRAAYQNMDKSSESVYTAKLGGTRYAFLTTTVPGGLFAYNMDRAVASVNCLEDSTNTGNVCPGVYVGQIATAASPMYVHGTGNYIAVSHSSGFQILDVSNPASPVSKLNVNVGQVLQGIAMWQQGSSYYVAARVGTSTNIWDVSCIATGCTGVGGPIGTYPTDTQSSAQYITFSRSGSTPFLYVGGDAPCPGSDTLQHEWLLDVTDPRNPKDISPQRTITATAPYNGVDTTRSLNYWNYYYRPSPTGFNLVSPRAGKFNGDYFYRAARSIFDIHKRTNSAPSANFDWSPTEVYPGTPVTFTDRSSGVPSSWSWTFQDGSPAASNASAPVVSFATVGTKSVSLAAGNAQGTSPVTTKSVVVLNPAPQVGGITVSPANPLVCQPVTFTATGVTGQPTLGYAWGVKDSGNNPVSGPASTTGTLTWTTGAGTAAGTYTATLTVSNGAGSASKSASVTLGALPQLAFTGANGAPTNDAFTAGTVKFHANGQGATEWNWDFGDGQGFRGWTSDPVNGPDPTVSYTATGQKNVVVKIRNCAQAEITSATLTINITQTTPLAAHFQAGLFCQFGMCFGTLGQAIDFSDTSTGATTWDYDWNHAVADAGTCNFTDTGHNAPVTSHTYTTAGDYHPCLRVSRGTNEQNVFVHGDINVAAPGGGGNGGGGGASLSISGPTSGQTSQAYTFSAAASGCTAAISGWNWNTGGGTVTGDPTASAISITWSSAGAKTVSVTNSGCSGASATRNVTISDPGSGGGGGGGTLQAAFSFSPGSPQPGQTVSFDAGASTGSPTDYTWDFGDGSAGSGKTVSHTYANAGSYIAQLSVSKPSTGCPFAPCVAESKAVKLVVVGTPVPTLSADFTANVDCVNVGGFDQCQAQTGKPVTLAATAADAAATYSWDFGDGKTGSGASVTHTWTKPDSYFVILTVAKGTANATKTRTFVVSGTPVPSVKSVVLPWIAQTRGALVQSSDLYVHNPSANPMTLTLEFRKRGLPESNPPKVDKTIAPGATLYVADVLGDLFDRANIAGYVSLTVKQGDMEPIITSYNTTVQSDGKQFGQTIGGVSMSSTGSAVGSDPGSPVQNLVGLISNSDRLAYFGVSNPNGTPTTYHLRFYDKAGNKIGESSEDLTVSSYGQRQFQAEEIQNTFGISNEDDYRVEVETKSGGGLIPYASNLRRSSEDPSFIEAGAAKGAKSYLIGVLSSPGLNNSTWRSDLVLSNTTAQALAVDVTFTNLGYTAVPTTPLRVTLQPGETRRLENVVAAQWNVTNGIGVLTVQATSTSSGSPVVQGESYDNTNPAKRFGQSMTAVTDADAADAGQASYLVGLRQDSGHRTTLWLFNPGTTQAEYDLVYRGLDGSVIDTMKGVLLGGGKLRQISPSQHPLPAAGVPDGFTLQVVVKRGKVLTAAQVVNNATNDPAYIQGEAQ